MALHYLVDGYNVLYALKEMPTGSWEQKRDALLQKISNVQPHGRNLITVVFDSREGLGDQSRQEGITIVYTAGETADDWISAKVRSVANARILVVVTDDQGLRRLIRGTGAKSISTQEFWKTNTRGKTPPPVSIDPGIQEDINDELRKKWL